eukprot:m.226070 g.226070  ORF g.226070 m.226070 type:complete len:1004 (-) comp15163_c0_seq5:188-3199(-)
MDEPLDMDEAMEEFEAMQDEDEWDAMHEDEWEALRDMDGPPAKRPTGTATASNASIEPSSQLTEAPDGSYSGGDKGGGIQATKSRVSDVLARVRATLGRTTGNASTSGSSGKSGPSSIAASSSNGQQPQQSQPEAESQSVPAVSSTDVFRNVFGIPAVKRAPLARTMQTRRSLAIRGEGKHVYLSTQDNKMKKATAGQSEGSSGVVASSAYPHQLLAVPMKSLRERVEQINMEKTLEANRRFQADIDRLDASMDDDATSALGPRETKLWVDEFSPRRYTDLISDEVVNKRMLMWIRRWDKVVHGVASKFTEPAQQQQQTPKFGLVDGVAEGDETAKVVLLTGPAGSGKTTLAHVVAAHAGYTTIEINASDDRSPEKIRERVLNATQMQEVIAGDRKPNCVILDEIDGATRAAITALIRIITADGKTAGGRKKSGLKPLKRPIICICNDLQAPALRELRTIAYTLHVNPIATTSLVTRLQHVCARKNVRAERQALVQLCDLTSGDVRSCLNTLQFLATKQESTAAGGEGAGSVGAGGGPRAITVKQLKETSIGHKDKAVDVKTIWAQLFDMSRARKRPFPVRGGASTGAQTTSASSSSLTAMYGGSSSTASATSSAYGPSQDASSRSLTRICMLINSNGEHRKLMDGAFENYLSIKGTSFDPQLTKVNATQDWLHFYQTLSDYIMEHQNYALMKYHAYAIASFHFNFGAAGRHRIRWPRTVFEADSLTKTRSRTLMEYADALAPSIKRCLSLQVLSIHVIPLLLSVITPNISPTSLAVLSPRDKQNMSNIALLMRHYNLSYKQDASEGSMSFVLSPRVDQIGRMGKESVFSGGTFSYRERSSGVVAESPAAQAVKQMIAQKISQLMMQHPSMRASNTSAAQSRTESFDGSGRGGFAPGTSGKYQQGSAPPLPRASTLTKSEEDVKAFMAQRMGLSKGSAKNIKDSQKVKRDFFGRIMSSQTQATAQEEGRAPVHRKKQLSLVWYRYNEGCTNAVRRTVHLNDIM